MAEKKEETKRYQIREVPTQTGLVITDTETSTDLDVLAVLSQIANDINEVKAILKR